MRSPVRRIAACFVFALMPFPLAAQQVTGTGAPPPAGYLVVTTCGTQSYPTTVNGKLVYAAPTILPNGEVCTSAIASGATTVTPNTGLTFTLTDQAVGAAGTATFAADATIKYLRVTNKGAGTLLYTLSATDAASATHGIPLAAALAAPGQGGSDFYETTAVPTKGLAFYAVAATTVEIVAGR